MAEGVPCMVLQRAGMSAPVTCLDVRGKLVAFAAGKRVFVWDSEAHVCRQVKHVRKVNWVALAAEHVVVADVGESISVYSY